jgi:hypothetical protein
MLCPVARPQIAAILFRPLTALARSYLEVGISVTDDRERAAASEIERRHPGWMVIWGCYSRMFWAFPCFQVPQGTIVSARDPESLLADMRRVETEFSYRPPGSSSHGSANALPRRVPLALRQKSQIREGELEPMASANVPEQAQNSPQITNGDPAMPGLTGSGYGDPLWAAAQDDYIHPLAPDGTIYS